MSATELDAASASLREASTAADAAPAAEKAEAHALVVVESRGSARTRMERAETAPLQAEVAARESDVDAAERRPSDSATSSARGRTRCSLAALAAAFPWRRGGGGGLPVDEGTSRRRWTRSGVEGVLEGILRRALPFFLLSFRKTKNELIFEREGEEKPKKLQKNQNLSSFLPSIPR